MTHKHLGGILIASAVLLEYAHWGVTSGTGTILPASAQNTLANLDETISPTIHLGYILGAIGVYLVLR